MNFDQRKDEAKRLVVKFLDDFSEPRGISPEGLANRIHFICDAFARKMPTKGDYSEMVGAVLMKIRDTHLSNSWPQQAAFVMAMPDGERPAFAQLQSFSPDLKEQIADQMNNGHAVPEFHVWGPVANTIDVPRPIIEKYKAASVKSWISTYGKECVGLMAEKYGDQVRMYFPQIAAQ